MRRFSLVLAVLLGVGLVGPASAALPGAAYPVPGGAGGVQTPPLPGVSITTDNVTHVGYLPEMGPTVSGRVVELEDERRFYVSSVSGLSIYNIDDPASPMLIGRLPLAGFQNEDMAVSDDGDIAVLAYGDTNNYSQNFVIDTSNPTVPALVGITDGGDHTAECVTPDCSWLYGSEGNIYDLSDPADPVTLDKTWLQHAREQGVQFATSGIDQFPHKVVLDDAGYLITDSSPRVVFDISDEGTPDAPKVVTQHENPGPAAQIRYQHNNLRPRADEYVPREPEDDDEALRDGELLLANGESNVTLSCGGNGGPFMTWDMRRFDEGRHFTLIETFRPLNNGDYLDGDPAVNALGCSGHWFDWTTSQNDDGTYVVSAAWFEHGVRFLEVEAATGAISEVGFFQPVNGSAGATYWIDDEYVYVTDYVRGVDILRFDHDPDLVPTQDELDANWLANLELVRQQGTPAGNQDFVCRLPLAGR